MDQVYISPVICLLARDAGIAPSFQRESQADCVAFWIYVQYRHSRMMKTKPTAFDSLNAPQRRAATFGAPIPRISC
jgi:hypothetical protein